MRTRHNVQRALALAEPYVNSLAYMVRAAGLPCFPSAALVLLGLVLADDIPRRDLSGAADPCYGAVVEGHAALSACTPNPEQLALAVVGMLQRQTSGSEAETWIRIGTRMHDLIVEGEEAPRTGSGHEGLSGTHCHSRTTDPRWHGALVLSRRAILTGLRLVADPRVAPLSGTHAGLFLSRTLIHPCTAADLAALPSHVDLWHGAERTGGSWAAVAPRARRFAQSGNTGQTHDGGLEQAAKEARERGDCAAAVRLIHAAAAAAPDSVGVWYTLQVHKKLAPPRSPHGSGWPLGYCGGGVLGSNSAQAAVQSRVFAFFGIKCLAAQPAGLRPKTTRQGMGLGWMSPPFPPLVFTFGRRSVFSVPGTLVQGYLAQKKLPPHRTLQWDYA